MPPKLTKEIFMERANKIHNSKYDYSLVEYINGFTKVKIICSEHNAFEQRPADHLKGNGCPSCKKEKLRTLKRRSGPEFKKLANKIHNSKYDYSLVEYINGSTKVKIICPEHGVFEQRPEGHLKGNGCPKCGIIKRAKTHSITKDNFLKRLAPEQKNNYIYDYIEFKDMKTDIKILCPKHGFFNQTPHAHLYMEQGCPECGIIKNSNSKKMSKKVFIDRANRVHNGKYDYSMIDDGLNIVKDKIKIVCPEHGLFLQKGNDHLRGHGCMQCTSWRYIQDKPTLLYYIKYNDTYKIGITTRKLEERFEEFYNKIEIIRVWEFPSGQEAYHIEQHVIEEFSEVRIKNEDFKRIGGTTEFFKIDILDGINDILANLDQLKKLVV